MDIKIKHNPVKNGKTPGEVRILSGYSSCVAITMATIPMIATTVDEIKSFLGDDNPAPPSSLINLPFKVSFASVSGLYSGKFAI